MYVHIADVKPKAGDLVRFSSDNYAKKQPPMDSLTYMAHGIEPEDQKMPLQQLLHKFMGEGVFVTGESFAVVLEVTSEDDSLGSFSRNSVWKLLHPEHGVLLVRGLGGWYCELIPC